MVSDQSPMLMLLNGPPASGKSTLAARWCADHPLALNLDIDVVRGLLGSWADNPHEAGLAARRLALAMIRTHLRQGHSVVVPQYLARVDFILELEALAGEMNTPFVEVVLTMSRDEAVAAFESRRARPENQTHRDAAVLVDAATGPDPVAEMFDRLEAMLAVRPETKRVPVVRGDIEATLARLVAAV